MFDHLQDVSKNKKWGSITCEQLLFNRWIPRHIRWLSLM